MMVATLLNKIFGSKNDREIKRLQPTVGRINALEPSLTPLTDEALAAKTDDFRKRLTAGQTLDDLLPEAFAVCREMARRTLGMRHFDVQLLGAMILHLGRISEMKTGEGKTLVATLALYLNALEDKGVHLVTVNDYLAKRDAQWMGPLYHALGLSVGVIQHDASFFFDPQYDAPDKRLQHLRPCTRPEAYRADITYGTNNEFGFDYLRDNLISTNIEQCVQRELNYAIVDEVDSILIDEARTPLIISGPTDESTDLYYRINSIIPQLKAERDYTIEEKTKTAALTEEGNVRVEKLLGVDNLYDLKNMDLVHHVVKALQAHALYKRDVDYVVKDGEVLIVDEFTGRLMPGRRWSDGLHQAVEAKEGVKIANENQTLASVTFQNYFRMYKKLAGMTGTADTEASEFAKIYNLDVNVIPTNRAMIRADYADVIYRTEREKFNAIVEEIKECRLRGQPVLVGTIAIEKSERLSAHLRKSGLLPSRLEELVRTAGLEGSKLERWIRQVADRHGIATDWLINVGVGATAVKQKLTDKRFQSLAAGGHDHGAELLAALLKESARSGPSGTSAVADERVVQSLVQLSQALDEKTLPIIDYLIELQCTPRRLIQVLDEKEVKHNVLNAKYHEKEAEVIAQAGRTGAVTIATNMAGRGTDILLGGNPDFLFKQVLYRGDELTEEQKKQFYDEIKTESEADKKQVLAAGGLHILGTERHESRRIDNQLRGRSGRQGDPGTSRFFLSLEDDLMRIFASERISNLMLKLGMEEGVPIEHRMVTRAIENAQKKVEAHNFDIRKQLLEYDDVMNKQREVIYEHRRMILTGEDLSEELQHMMGEVVDALLNVYCPAEAYPEEWDFNSLAESFQGQFGVDINRKLVPKTGGDGTEITDIKHLGREALREELLERVQAAYKQKEQDLGSDLLRYLEKMVLLQVIDHHWKDHLLAIDQLRDGIGLRGYGQKDPLVEYKREGYDMFAAMMDRIKSDSLARLFLVQVAREAAQAAPAVQTPSPSRLTLNRGDEPVAQKTVHRDHDKVGRNDPCPCGSGKKYKKCHGK
jgi:preprotein translocase subunit SecA